MIKEAIDFLEGPAADFFGKTYLNSKIFFIDNYSFLHLTGGILIMFLLFLFFKKLKLRYRFLILFLLAFSWEIIEIVVPWFARDSITNSISDLVFEMAGGLLFLGIRKVFKKTGARKHRRRKNKKP